MIEQALENIRKRGRHRLVILESPYAAANGRTVEEHVEYARACLRHSLSLGEAPIASHLLYTQPGILDDNIPAERALGISAGLAWRYAADHHAFYIDLGWSKGMIEARDKLINYLGAFGVAQYEVRSIGWPK